MQPSDVNGHAIMAVEAAMTPEPPTIGANVTLDAKKIGVEGNRLLGSIETLSRWSDLLAMYAGKALDLTERRTLLDVRDSLVEDAERLKLDLARLAIKRGAGKITPTDEGR